MPLDKSKTDRAVARNIRELIKAGHDRDQAIAIALNVAGRSRKRRRPKK